jgi:hypothetical protein
MHYFLIFHGNSGYVNAPQYYIVLKIPVLFGPDLCNYDLDKPWQLQHQHFITLCNDVYTQVHKLGGSAQKYTILYSVQISAESHELFVLHVTCEIRVMSQV